MHQTVMNTQSHLIQIDDDFAERTAICTCGYRFISDIRNEKMAAAYQHLADVYRNA